MMSFGPPRRAVNDPKVGKDRTHDRQTQGESYRSAHGARLTSYTEKSLLVVKDYVFLEKKQNKDAGNFGDTFHGMPDGVNVPRYMWDTVTSMARRENKRKKAKTWLPNGGGMKPYAPEAAKPAAAEDCVIDMRAVRPKVDSWYRPKNRRSLSPDEPKLNKKAGSPLKSPPKSPRRAATTALPSKRTDVEPPDGTSRSFENRSDSAVKSLTSYWNDHLKRHPFTMSVPQKQLKPEDNGLRDRGYDWRKISQNSQARVVQGRPKSVGSDGVVQEHTLVPSKVLADKKMSSVEDIITFVRRSSRTRTVVKTETLSDRQQTVEKKPDEEQADTNDVPDIPTSAPTPPPSPNIQPERKPKPSASTSTSNIDSYNESSRKSRHRHHHRHPLFVVRLHTRWMLAFKVLTLTFRPLIEAWKRRWKNETKDTIDHAGTPSVYQLCQGDTVEGVTCQPVFSKNPERNHKTNLKFKRKEASQISGSSKIGRLQKLARRGMSDTLKFLSRARRRKLSPEDVTKTSDVGFVVTDLCGPQTESSVKFLAGRKSSGERTALVTEPLVSSLGPVVVYDEAKSSTAKAASLEVLPRGLRMSLYVEYHLIISFFLVQSTLFLIVLFIKWLQEYTT